jgi:hypothetical protein
MRKEIVLALWMLAMAFGGAARADDVSELKTQLAEQQKLLLQMQQRIEQLEANQKAQAQSVDEKITKAVASKDVNVPDSLKWAEKIKLSGDFRYRHESINSKSSGKDQPGTNRHRIRARLGLDVKVNDEVDLGFRLATGASDPASTNQSLEDGFAKKDVWLDLAYFNWHPAKYKGLSVLGGKMPLPFYRAGNNQLIWDDDVNPEGLAAKYVIPLGATNNLYINGGGFWLKADSGTTGGAAMWGIQSYLKHDFENKDYLLGGVSFYAFGDIKGKEGLYKSSGTGSSKFGNTMSGLGTTASPYRYMMDYDVLEGFAEYGFKVADLPTSVYGSYVKNTSATTSEDSGWLIGTTFNKAKEAKSWEVGYNYRDVQKDAVVGVLTDSDFVGGGTDGRGHMFYGKYQLTKNVQAGLTYFLAKKGDAKDDYRRLMADLIFKF